MIGIGLGGFMDGFQRGQQARESMDASKRRKVMQERQDTEYNRGVEQRDAIDAIGKQAQTEFDSQVKAGTMAPEDFDSFWNKYTIPKLKQQYLLNGDIDKADTVQKWGESEDAREGGRLFTSSLLKAQTGDAAGALDDAMKLGKLKGYMSHGYEVLGHDSLVSKEGGPVVGYQIKLKTPDGKELFQKVKSEDMPRLIATFANPQAAMESQLAASSQKAKAEAELDTYKKKKDIDRQYGLGKEGGEAKLRSDAITTLRKRMDGGLDGSEGKFDDLPRDQQEKLIQQETELISGQPGLAGEVPQKPERKVLVDTVAGRAVDPAAERQPAANAAQETVKREQQGPADGRNAGQRASATMLQQAADMLANGVPAETVGQGLVDAGIPPEQWPAALKNAIAEASQKSIGLGGNR